MCAFVCIVYMRHGEQVAELEGNGHLCPETRHLCPVQATSPMPPGFPQQLRWGPMGGGCIQKDRKVKWGSGLHKTEDRTPATFYHSSAALAPKGARAGSIRLSNGRQEVTMLKQALRGLNLVFLC